jgi:hypothetical protein
VRIMMKFAGFPVLGAAAVLLLSCTGTISEPADPGFNGSGATGGVLGSGTGGKSGGKAGASAASGGASGSSAGGSGGSSAGGSGGSSAGSGTGGSAGTGTPQAVFGEFTRLTRAEYAATVTAALGVEVDLAIIPEDGRIGVYTSNASVSPDPVHPYLLAAEDLAALLIPAELPACDGAEADNCLRDDYREPIEALYRRPLTDAELTRLATMLETLVDGGTSATDATRTVLVSALLSPDFLFRASPIAADAAGAARRLADTLSFALWDEPPDAELAGVATSTASELSARLREQATRLGSDARAIPVIARFLAQWLHVDTDLRLSDAAFATSPRFLELIAYVEDALESQAPVRDLVAGRRGFVHEDNLEAYGLDSLSGSGTVVGLDWPAPSKRRGLVSEELFADATRHPDEGRRPIFRGKLVRTSLLCDTIDPPSADLLALADEVSDRTTDVRCRGCHTLLDPIGRTFASLDIDHEGTVPAAEILGHPGLEGTYADLPALLEAVAGSRSFAECFSRHWLAFFLEQELAAADPTWVAELADLVEAGASLGEVVEQTIVALESRAKLAVPWCEGP